MIFLISMSAKEVSRIDNLVTSPVKLFCLEIQCVHVLETDLSSL